MLNSFANRHLRQWLAAAACGAAAFLSGAAAAAPPGSTSGNRDSKDDAVEAIPFDKLTRETKAKLWDVVSKPSIYRRLPTQVVPCDPEMFLFLVRYPEVVVNIWELMGITNVSAKRTGQYSFSTSDGAGTVGHVELVYGTQDMHIVYCEGYYEGPLFKRKLNGKCVLVLRSGYSRDQDDRSQISSRLDMFLQIENAGAELVAKSLQPLVGKAADHNFTETAIFMGRLSQAAERNSSSFQKMTGRLANVEPEVRDRFAELAQSLSAKSGEREGAAAAAIESQPEGVRSASLQEEPRRLEPARRIVTPK